jgi:hypothetical protein
MRQFRHACAIVVVASAIASAGETCEAPPSAAPITSLERNLNRVEAITHAIQRTTASFCRAWTNFDYAAAKAAFTSESWSLRFYPVVQTPLGMVDGASLLSPPNPPCFGRGAAIVDDLKQLNSDWVRVDRCFFKPHEVLASEGDHPRAKVKLQLWLGGQARDGSRVTDQGDVSADMEESADGTWRFTRMQPLPRARFRSSVRAFADLTGAVSLPVDWVDSGYQNGGISEGQILYGGVAVGDYDGDGWPDLFISRAGKHLLLRNDHGKRFEDVTEKAGLGGVEGNTQAAVFADFDNDGHPDLFIVNASYKLAPTPGSNRGHLLYHNNGDGTFTRVPGMFGPVGPASGVSVADFDGDGLLDIYVTYYQDEALHPYHHRIEARDGFGNHLYRNLGGMRFEDVTERAGVGGKGWSYASAWADLDEDGRIDLVVANDFGNADFYRNLGGGRFEEAGAGKNISNPANGMSVDIGDYDNDGHLDVYIANMYSHSGNIFVPLYSDLDDSLRKKLTFAAQGSALYRNTGEGSFEETGRMAKVNVAGWAWGSNFFDYNNDGRLDLFAANGLWAGESESDA